MNQAVKKINNMGYSTVMLLSMVSAITGTALVVAGAFLLR